MRIDFHYHATKVLCMLSGFSESDAQITAYASQYVDDASDENEIYIAGLPPDLSMYKYFKPVQTAHKTLLQFITQGGFKKEHTTVYIPFHFAAERNDLIVEPDNNIAAEILKDALISLYYGQTTITRLKALIKLGIALHTYADTWAHQGFSGTSSLSNAVNNITVNGAAYNHVTQNLYIGHAGLDILPDRSDCNYQYEKGGEFFDIDNSQLFTLALKAMFNYLANFNNADLNVDSAIWQLFIECFKNCPDYEDGDIQTINRHYEKYFKDIPFYYDENEWKSSCLYLTSPGIRPQYIHRGDNRWLYFNGAASDQAARFIGKM